MVITHAESSGCFPPQSLLYREKDGNDVLEGIRLPAVAKPVRGRWSYGVTWVNTRDELRSFWGSRGRF